jgi:hypothetical protein
MYTKLSVFAGEGEKNFLYFLFVNPCFFLLFSDGSTFKTNGLSKRWKFFASLRALQYLYKKISTSQLLTDN